jgi:hypothetical protein
MNAFNFSDIHALKDRLAVLRGIKAQAISEIGSLMLARGGQLTDPDDAFLFEQWSILSRSADAEADDVIAKLAEVEARWSKQSRLDASRALESAGIVASAYQVAQKRPDHLRKCLSCRNRFNPESDETLCHVHREKKPSSPRRPYQGWPEKLPVKNTDKVIAPSPKEPDHKPWREWPSCVEDVEPVVPVRAISDDDNDSDHIIADTVEKRAKAIMAWAPPWARRARYQRARRYEGFTAGDR